MRFVWKFVTVSMLALLAVSCGEGDTGVTDTGAVTLPGDEETAEEATTLAEQPAEAESSEDESETTAAETTVVEQETTASSETTAVETTETSDTAPAETTASSETTTSDPVEGPAGSLGLKIVSINFDNSEVQVTNSGSAAVDISSYTWCNFPEYVGVGGGGVIEPGATLTLTSTVQITPAAGELGLYRTTDFADSNAIAAYVEWGTPDHERAPVAVAAGIWNGEPLTVDGSTLTNG